MTEQTEKFKSYKEQSRRDWGADLEVGKTLNREQITLGAVLRIADATEVMAQTHIQLQNSYKYMKESRDNYQRKCELLDYKVRALKGHITRLKKQLNTKP